jgi:MFS family permease
MKSSATTVPELDNHSVPQRFIRVRLTWASYWMLGYFAFLEAVLGPLMPFIRGDLHLNYLLASLHFSAFALGAMAMGAMGDRLTHWWGRRASFWGGGVGMAAGAALLALSPSAVGTIAGAFLMGLLGNLLLITIQAALADHHAAWSPVALTEANVAASGFALLASVSVGAITGIGWSWRLTLVVALALLAVAGARYHAVRFPMKTATSPAEAHLTPKNQARPRRAFWAYWWLLALETGVEWSVVYWGASFLATHAGFTNADAATATGALFLAMLFGRYAGSRLARRFSGLVILVASLAIALVGFPIFWLVPVPLLRVFGLFVVGLGLANVYPLSIALASRTMPDQSDRASARLSIAAALSALLAPFALGALADNIGIGYAFGIVVPMLLLALLAALLAGRGMSGSPPF